MGMATDACSAFLNDPNVNVVLEALVSANPSCGIAFDYDIENNPHVYSTCTCSSIQPATNSG